MDSYSKRPFRRGEPGCCFSAFIDIFSAPEALLMLSCPVFTLTRCSDLAISYASPNSYLGFPHFKNLLQAEAISSCFFTQTYFGSYKYMKTKESSFLKFIITCVFLFLNKIYCKTFK